MTIRAVFSYIQCTLTLQLYTHSMYSYIVADELRGLLAVWPVWRHAGTGAELPGRLPLPQSLPPAHGGAPRSRQTPRDRRIQVASNQRQWQAVATIRRASYGGWHASTGYNLALLLAFKNMFCWFVLLFCFVMQFWFVYSCVLCNRCDVQNNVAKLT